MTRLRMEEALGTRAVACLLALMFVAGCGRSQEQISIAIGSTLDTPAFPDSAAWVADVRAFYEGRRMRPAWTDSHGLTARGRRIVAMLDSLAREGLAPARYGTLEIRQLQDAIGEVTADDEAGALIGSLDALITTGYRRYLGDLDASALADPSVNDRPVRAPDALVGLLDATARGEEPARIAASVRPADEQYSALMSALVRYTEIARRGGWPVVDPRMDSVATAVMLRARLIAEADPRETELALEASEGPATFDRSLVNALRRFQQRHGLEQTGELDAATLAELNTPVEERIAVLALNLDRWRAMPRGSDELRIRVNVPEYRLVVVENGRPTMSMKVVVGSADNQTPVMIDTMEYVVTNPYWNVPASILAEEIAPAMAMDDDYLDDHRMEVVSRSDPARVVNSGSIDWAGVDVDSIDWMVRQRPGPGNALGAVKFLFPNPQHIYLHDTPSRSGFSKSIRALSHGCIRLEKPLDLARFVLERRASEVPGLDKLLADPEERHIALETGIPVQILYMTAWVDQGSVRFFDDIYGRDRRLTDRVRTRLLMPKEPVHPAATD